MTYKIINLESGKNYQLENPQLIDIRYTFAKKESEDTYYALHRSVSCRDKLMVIPSVIHLGWRVPYFHGFEIKDISEFRNYKDRCYLIITGDSDYLSSINKNLKLLYELDIWLGVKYTECIYEEGRNELILDFDIKWTTSPILLSIYSLLIRLIANGLYQNTIFLLLIRLRDYLKELREDDEDLYDQCDAELKLVDSLLDVDIEFLIRNIDYIIKDNPITGINDKDCDQGFNLKGNSEFRNICEVTSTPSKKYNFRVGDVKKLEYIYFPCHSGIHSFSTKVSSLRRGYDIKMYFGVDWAIKYVELLIDSGKLTWTK